jgi:DNA-binding MarR family transcriptional regulator
VKSRPSNLEGHLGYWLRQLSNRVSHKFAERIAKHDISVSGWVVLRVLFDADAMPLKDLASHIGVDQGALSRMVERLMVRELVIRRENPSDRRQVAISLSPKGKRLVPKLAREADQNDRAFFDHLPTEKRQEFLGTIQALLALNPVKAPNVALD